MVSLRIPSPQALWERHERLVLEVFSCALTKLRCRNSLPEKEDNLSELLALETRNANFILNQEGRGLDHPPQWEKPKQPATESDIGRDATYKRPDFSCAFRDPAAPDAGSAYLDYHVECKRLGQRPSSNWNLNRNYVQRGIHRFLDSGFAYGERATSGAMIGYVQSMSLAALVAEVGGYLREYLEMHPESRVNTLGFPDKDFASDGTAQASQEWARTHVPPARFTLRHIWVDLQRMA